MICDKTIEHSGAPFNPETDCPVERARSVMKEAAVNSCGKCVFCREGTLQIAVILEDMTGGKGQDEDRLLVQELCEVTRQAAGCEPAQEAARECLDLLQEYEAEFEQHIVRKRCQKLVCKSYYTLHAMPADCTGCGACKGICPQDAVKGASGLIHVIDNERCDRCLLCVDACPSGAIKKAGAVKPKCPDEPVAVGSFGAPEGGTRRRRRS